MALKRADLVKELVAQGAEQLHGGQVLLAPAPACSFCCSNLSDPTIPQLTNWLAMVKRVAKELESSRSNKPAKTGPKGSFSTFLGEFSSASLRVCISIAIRLVMVTNDQLTYNSRASYD